MKKHLTKFTYRIVSWLSDRSGGWSLFVNWKIALAAIMIGFSTGTLTSCCYAPVPEDEEVMCYAVSYEEEPKEQEDDQNYAHNAAASSDAEN